MSGFQKFESEPLGPPMPTNRRMKDHTDRRCGRLTLLKPWILRKTSPLGYGWLAACDCGRFRVGLPAEMSRVGHCGCGGAWEAEQEMGAEIVTVNGVEKTIAEWAEHSGQTVEQIHNRLRLRWLPVAAAVGYHESPPQNR